MRILGIDYGDSYIGLALSDPMGIIASGLTTIKSITMAKDIDAIADIAIAKEASKIVIGLPLNMDGSEGTRASKTRSFGKVLERVSGKEIIYQDERLTTVSAARVLDASGVAKKNQKNFIDTTSAQIILQTYLEKNRF